MQNRHITQTQILKKLLFADTLKYSETKPSKEMPNNEFQFHLDKLILEGLIEKRDKKYSLTYKGKEEAGRLDTNKLKKTKQSKISARIITTRDHNTSKQVLIYKRLKQPFFGKQGFPAGKVEYGELFKESAKREFFEETNLKGEPRLFLIEHWLTFNKEDDKLLNDKLFINFIIENPKGELKGCEEGEYEWINIENLDEEIKTPFLTVDYIKEIIEHSKNQIPIFIEKSHHTSDF